MLTSSARSSMTSNVKNAMTRRSWSAWNWAEPVQTLTADTTHVALLSPLRALYGALAALGSSAMMRIGSICGNHTCGVTSIIMSTSFNRRDIDDKRRSEKTAP
ncbi:hypothetical protein KC19_VG014600 [Ceratodon purpureus]|uniref:Uncharacterized protein n=1 Tax=Ceratodon purpureus TaxID=3225 RepID=A0A8T0HKZ6_CERPU|nr:hypothetical protein KC19_VG014600 [Ceratodon purpureus]